jgi:hypothetical protein
MVVWGDEEVKKLLAAQTDCVVYIELLHLLIARRDILLDVIQERKKE